MPAIRVAAVQCPSVAGDIERNIAVHLQMIDAALDRDVELIVFPELSLTGYEMAFAERCKLRLDDPRLAPFRQRAFQHRVTLIIGAPLAMEQGPPALGAIIFSPSGVSHYHKQHLFGQEAAFFQPGLPGAPIPVKAVQVAPAICADTGSPEHAAAAAAAQADIYAASVMVTPEGLDADRRQMQNYARLHGMATLFANHSAPTGGLASGGGSAIWGPNGERLCEAEGTESCLVIAEQKAQSWKGSCVRVELEAHRSQSRNCA